MRSPISLDTSPSFCASAPACCSWPGAAFFIGSTAVADIGETPIGETVALGTKLSGTWGISLPLSLTAVVGVHHLGLLARVPLLADARCGGQEARRHRSKR